MAANSTVDGSVLLSSSVSVTRYREMESVADRAGLSAFLEERLSERYIRPLRSSCKKNGFLMMGVSCLLIETLESFYQGWEDTNVGMNRNDIRNSCKPSDPKRTTVSKSEVAFCYFFQRFTAFSALHPVSQDFYKNVRCGILHQGETTGGWRVLRRGPVLFDASTHVVNARRFFSEVGRALGAYADELRNSDWNDTVWNNFKTKMKAIIKHCIPTP